MQILDYAAGYLMALAAMRRLRRQARGRQLARAGVAGATGHWLRGLGRVPGGLDATPPDFAPYLETADSGFGRLTALRHAAQLSATPAGWAGPRCRRARTRWPGRGIEPETGVTDRLRFGMFLAPFHKPGINPTLALPTTWS